MEKVLLIIVAIALVLTVSHYRKSKTLPAGTLYVGTTDALIKYPWEAQSVDQLALVSQTYESLTQVDSLGVAKPAIATSWSLSADKLVWTFSINSAAVFSNGSPIHAIDVKSSIEHTTQKGSVSSSGTVLEAVSGFLAFHSSGSANELAGVKAVDDHTLTIALDEPWADLPAALSSSAFGIAPSAAAAINPPVGSGKMKYETFSDNSTDLVPVGGTSAHVRRIRWMHVKTPAELDSLVGHNKIDVALGTTSSKRVDSFDYAGNFSFYGINAKSAVLADQAVRNAIEHSIDRPGIVADVYRGLDVVSNGVVPRGFPGFTGNACGSTCNSDVAGAKAAVTAMSPAPSPLHIDTDDSLAQRLLGQKLQSALEGVGFKVEVRVHASDQYAKFLQSGQQEIFQIGRVPEYLSSDAVVWPLFSSGSPDNVTGFHDDAIDIALQSARSTDKLEDRSAMFGQIEVKALAAAEIIPLAQVRRSVGESSRLRDFKLDIMGDFDPTKVSLAS